MKRLPALVSNLTPRRTRGAFTLIELLSVMGVMLVFVSLSLPLVGDVMASRATERAAMELSGLLEYARREAVALQTYTWVGIEEVTDEGGQTSLKASVRVSRTGAIDPVSAGGGTLVNMSGVEVLTRTYRWPNVKLVEPDDLEQVSLPTGVALTSFTGTASSGFATVVNIGTEARPRLRVDPTYMSTVTFGPSGTAFLSTIPSLSAPYSENIGIAFKYDTARKDEALLYLNGLTGAVRIVR